MNMPPIRAIHGLGFGNQPKPRIQPTRAAIRMAVAWRSVRHGNGRREPAGVSGIECPTPEGHNATWSSFRLRHGRQGAESNKGLSERLKQSGRKSIRVRAESPSKNPKNGVQTVPSPIGLVGAIGEACGEAPACPFSCTPPFFVVGLPLILRIVIVRWV